MCGMGKMAGFFTGIEVFSLVKPLFLDDDTFLAGFLIEDWRSNLNVVHFYTLNAFTVCG
jgi:hypothetical protein